MRLAEQAGAALFRAGSCLAELTHLVERTEHVRYEAAMGAIPLKEYRHNITTERARVVRELRKVWLQIKADGRLLELPLDDAVNDAMMARSDKEPVDGYDLYTLEVMHGHNVTQLLSDDGDFCSVGGITMFTANVRVIAAAKARGLLVVR